MSCGGGVGVVGVLGYFLHTHHCQSGILRALTAPTNSIIHTTGRQRAKKRLKDGVGLCQLNKKLPQPKIKPNSALLL